MCEDEAVGEEKVKTLVCLGILIKETEWLTGCFSKSEETERMLAWICRFIGNCRTPKCKRSSEQCVDELKFAVNFVFSLTEEELFYCVEEKQLVSSKTKLLLCQDSFSFKCPVILPSEHTVMKRLIWDKHVRHCYAGAQLLLSLLREHYWILGGRQTIKSVISKCAGCCHFEGRRSDPAMAPLPTDRVGEASVFEMCMKYVGLTLWG